MTKKPVKKVDSITTSQPFAGLIIAGERGSKTLKVRSTSYYHHQINKFRMGEQVTLYITNRRPKRTLAQNAYLWGAFYPLIAEETGERDLDRLHELFKGKFLTVGIVEVLGEKVRIKKSTTNLSISEFSSFIHAIEELTGIQAPPIENYGMDNDLTNSNRSV